MTIEELRDYVEEERSQNNIPYHVYSALIDGIDTLEQEPCEDAISRQAAVNVASGFCHLANVADELAKLPPVNPQPKTGHWIDVFGGCKCSECDCLEGGYSNYCPTCGIKMVEPQESEEQI